MKFVATVRSLLHRHRRQLGLSLRVTVAALVSLAAAQILKLHLPLWAVLASIVVTQMSVGRSLKATIDYLSGTLGGAVFGTLVATFVPHASEPGLLVVLAVAVAPLALLAALRPKFVSAPATSAIVILLPALTHASSAASALDRVLEVSVGGIAGLAVSFLLLPANAHRIAIDAIARTLDQMANALDALFLGMERGLDMASLHRIQDHIGIALNQLSAVGAEAEQERAARLARGPGLGPLLGVLLRLRHDLVMIGRVAISPLPESFRLRLRPSMSRIESTTVAWLHECGAALVARQAAPPLDRVEAALAAHDAEVAAMRGEGLTRDLPDEGAEQFFALGFVLQQAQGTLRELQARVTEWASSASD